MEINMEVPQETKSMTLLYNLGIYPKESQSTSIRNMCIPMFIATLFTVAKLLNQHQCAVNIK
jgi:hypothetical protein